MSWIDRLLGHDDPAPPDPLRAPVEYHGLDGLEELAGPGPDDDGYRRYGAIWDDDGRPDELYERDARAWAVRNGLEARTGDGAVFVKRRPDRTVRVALDARPSGDGDPGDREPDGPEQGEAGPEGDEDGGGGGVVQ